MSVENVLKYMLLYIIVVFFIYIYIFLLKNVFLHFLSPPSLFFGLLTQPIHKQRLLLKSRNSFYTRIFFILASLSTITFFQKWFPSNTYFLLTFLAILFRYYLLNSNDSQYYPSISFMALFVGSHTQQNLPKIVFCTDFSLGHSWS